MTFFEQLREGAAELRLQARECLNPNRGQYLLELAANCEAAARLAALHERAVATKMAMKTAIRTPGLAVGDVVPEHTSAVIDLLAFTPESQP
jgi:hypothetical protein